MLQMIIGHYKKALYLEMLSISFFPLIKPLCIGHSWTGLQVWQRGKITWSQHGGGPLDKHLCNINGSSDLLCVSSMLTSYLKLICVWFHVGTHLFGDCVWRFCRFLGVLSLVGCTSFFLSLLLDLFIGFVTFFLSYLNLPCGGCHILGIITLCNHFVPIVGDYHFLRYACQVLL